MAALRRAEAPAPMGPGRAPVWPEGVVGSVAHCATACLAAVARTRSFAALGIDVEPDLPLEEALWKDVLTPGELASIAARPAGERDRLVRLIFSIKECAYKTKHPLTCTLYGFAETLIPLGKATV